MSRPNRPATGLKRALALAGLAAAVMMMATGCGSVIGLPPNMSADPCLACRQNCSMTGRMCGSSSASEMACRSKLADCEYKCRKRYCPREKDSPDAEDAGTPASETPSEAAP